MEYENQKILVLHGGNSGIAEKLILNEQHQKKIITLVRNKNENSALMHSYPCNAVDDVDVKKTMDRIVEDYQFVHEYVHLIGSILLKPLHLTSLEEWKQVMDTNLNSIFYSLKSVLPIMQKQKQGNIVLVSSIAAQVGLMNHEAISAAKGAVESLTRSLAMTYSHYGIRVNCVAPSLTKTKMAAFLTNNDIAVKATTSLNAIKRIGEPEDVANAISFLLSEKSSFITGQIISIDGGLSHLRTPPKL
jgi:NAD(P)-dependent dehydrogenase (short-subunit alcohol dehydrogenase family)